MKIAQIVVNATTGHCILRKRIPAGIVGAIVAVQFCDPVWDRLAKTVVFRGSDTKIAEFDGKTAVIPWEVLQEPGQMLFFGIWGSDPDSDLQLPLIEVMIGTIEAATNPEADPGTDPTLPIWAQLKQFIERVASDMRKYVKSVGGSTPDENGNVAITKENLPAGVPYVTDKADLRKKYVVVKATDENGFPTEWGLGSMSSVQVDKKPVNSVAGIEPDENGNVELTGFVKTEDIPEVINEALAQAKESGEFKGDPGKDGYTPVKGVDYFDGAPGKDGYTPVKGVDYFDGQPGEPGKDGDPGYTPVKGKDYYTEADKSEMVNAVLSALPTWTGGSY